MFSKMRMKMFDNKKHNTASDLAMGFIAGAAAASVFFIVKAMKKGKKCSTKAVNCDPCHSDNTYENFCDCDGEHGDYERARNGCGAEEQDVDILHSHGCLGYPHDNYYGFADSNGDRPNDLSNPEIEGSKGIPEGNVSAPPTAVKNARGKNNPQPENKVNEVK